MCIYPVFVDFAAEFFYKKYESKFCFVDNSTGVASTLKLIIFHTKRMNVESAEKERFRSTGSLDALGIQFSPDAPPTAGTDRDRTQSAVIPLKS